MAIATDSNPGTSPLTSLLLALNMAATLFGLTVEEAIAGVTREAARALGRLGDIGTLERGKWCDLAIWDIERPAELVYRIGFNPLHARVRRGDDDHADAGTQQRLPTGARLPTARGVRLDPAALPAVEASAPDGRRASSRAASRSTASIPASASSRACTSAPDDLATLQRNIVLSHAAGVGEPMPAANVRLMMALKLASLGHGASGVRPQTIAMLEAMLERGDRARWSRARARSARPAISRRSRTWRRRCSASAKRGSPARPCRPHAALARAGLAPLVLGPKEGLALLNGTQFSTAEALAGLFAIERVFHAALVTGALSTDAAKGSDTPFDARIHALRGHRGQIEVAAALRALMAGSADPRLAPRQRRPRAGPLLPALPAAGDGRRARSRCARPRRRWRPRPTASPTIR